MFSRFFLDIVISDPKFNGVNSIMTRAIDASLRHVTHFEIDVKPEGLMADGTLIHIGQSRNQIEHADFAHLSLINGTVGKA